MAEGQTTDPTNGERSKDLRAELTRPVAILLGLALIISTLNNQAVKLSGQFLPELPKPGVPAARVVAGSALGPCRGAPRARP